MKTKGFFHAFTLLYNISREHLNIQQKEKFYRLLLGDVYPENDAVMYDNDTVRHITSGNTTLHHRLIKRLHTIKGFEIFRQQIAQCCLPCLKSDTVLKLLQLCDSSENIPDNVKQQMRDSMAEHTEYQLSRAIAGILVCLNYADYMDVKGKKDFIDTNFMRLASERPLPQYPRYITDSPDAAVEELVGREDDLKAVADCILDGNGKLFISAVGGLGKTELVKKFLNDLLITETDHCGVEAIAWIPYNSQDIRMSMKQALSLQGELDDVWQAVQDMASEYRERLLLVVDNIETLANDEYLWKLSSLQCRILVTSRQRNLFGFTSSLNLLPLKMEDCRTLFYRHYVFENRDNEMLNDIIELTARLTIMIVFIAKAAYLEGLSLRELYNKLVDKGFKLSEEDVSCEHEKMQNDETIIHQMCILFSLIKYSNEDKIILTYISVIPNLHFDFTKAKKWFKLKKNSSLLKLFQMGMLEHSTKRRSHIYWMHSVIAAAVREQQKNTLYETASPFIHELSEEMEIGEYWGKGYKKIDLIPFSWSIADLFENHWGNEDDSTFLLRLYYICFEASSYTFCRKILEKVLEIDKSLGVPEMLIRDYKSYSELLLRFDAVPEAIRNLDIAQEYMKQIDPKKQQKREWAYLWHQYGNIYYHDGEALKALDYYTEALKIDLTIANLPTRELSTDYSSIAAVYQLVGDLPAAYQMLTKAIEIDPIDEDDSESITNYYYMAGICSDFVGNGYNEYREKAQECYEKVITFREKYAVKPSSDLADVYMEYSNFLYQIEENNKSTHYMEMAYNIYRSLYGEDSYHILQCQGNRALIAAETGQLGKAIEIYADIIDRVSVIENIPMSDLCNDYYNYAMLLEEADMWEKSIKYFQMCIDLMTELFSEDAPRLVQPYLGIVNCYMGLDQYDTAISYLEKLKKFSDDDPLLLRIIYHKLATCYVGLEKYCEAVELLNSALALCDKNGATDPGYIYVDLSIVHHYMNQIDQSKIYEKMARDFAQQCGDEELSAYIHTLDIFENEK